MRLPLVPTLGLALATGLLSYPLLLAAPSLPYGSDLAFAAQSARGFVQGLQEGQLYPRWVEASNLGFGGPTFIFYPPIAYYAVALASAVTGDVLVGLGVVLIFAGLLSGITFYLAFREPTSEIAATIGAGLYMLAPYHVLDAYWRFALAEHVAFIWFPLLLLFARRVIDGAGWRSVGGLAASYAGLVMTHLVTAYMVLMILAPYAVVLMARSRSWHRAGHLAAGGVLALLCSGIYLVPIIAQRDQVHLQWVRDAHYGDFRRNFAYRNERLLGYSWAPIKPFINRCVTAQGALALTAGAAFLWCRRRRTDRPGAVAWEAGAHGILSVWTFFMQIPASLLVWRWVPELETIQFPWRFGVFQALSACALTSLAIAAWIAAWGGDRARWTVERWASAVMLALAVLPLLWVTHELQWVRPMIFDTRRALHPAVSGRPMLEYIPLGVVRWREFKDLVPQQVPALELLGPGSTDVVFWGSHRREARVHAPDPVTLRMRTFVYPGWTARVDGEVVPIRPGGPFDTIQLRVPSGEHRVELEFEPTHDRLLGRAISAMGVLALIALLVGARLRRAHST
ncbi:MAG: 6-pyruvoyl-tetrahydropterin synthase-related protein [Myxococcota bacterium]